MRGEPRSKLERTQLRIFHQHGGKGQQRAEELKRAMQNKDKTAKTKQFSARTAHTRSASYGRNLNKLARITSSDDVRHSQLHHGGSQAQLARPLLNRSRSTDGIPGRRNRSFTKLAALQPLTRTRSQQHVPRAPSKVVIDIHNESSEDEHEQDGDNEEVEEEEVDAFSDEDISVEHEEHAREHTPPPLQQQPLSYRAPPQFSHKNVPSGSDRESTPQKSLIDPSELAKATAELSLDKQNQIGHHAGIDRTQAPAQSGNEPSEKRSSNELAQYHQNMILSQSTGLVRQFSDLPPFHNSLLPDSMRPAKSNDLQYIHSNDHISGTIPNIKSVNESNNSLKQFTIQSIANSHESGSMLSFKAEPVRRDQLQMTALPTAAQAARESPIGTPNLSQFLRSGPSNIETRTQQKLWLQRENSLMDIASVKNNATAITPQVRREFERVSREFMNIRRFANPINDAVKRVNTGIKSSKASVPPSQDHIRALRNEQSQALLMKLWIQADHHQPSLPPSQQYQHPPSQQYPTQRPQLQQGQRPSLMHNQSAYGITNPSNGLRAAVAPTTRAVDRANQSPENKRIDLAAMRHAEEVQKLS